MTRMRVALPAVIALGSNQGDRERLLREAVHAIDGLGGVRVVSASGIVETPALTPHGVDEEAPSYLNAVIIAMVSLQPEELLQQLHSIEAKLGRVREAVWGDRTIDLDLIDFAGLTRRNDTITIPHPRAWQRAFVLAPWLQVHPDAVLAGSALGTEESDSASPSSAAAVTDVPSNTAPSNTAPSSTASNSAAPRTPRRVADLLAAATDRVTDYPAAPLMGVLTR